MMDTPCIILDNVTFFSDITHHKILSDLSINIPVNKVTCLLGASGSGKSTILRLIAGLETPYSGTITLRNQIVSQDNTIFLKPEKRKIALMFQDYALMPFISVLENVLFAVKSSQQTPQDTQKADTILHDLELLSHRNKYPHQLSGGEQQRLALARTIMQNTDIVMLDEPFSNLDSELRRRLRTETLLVLKKHHKTILMVTHDPTEAFLSADNIIYLRDGRIIQSGSPQDIYFNPKNMDIALFAGAANILSGIAHDDYLETPLGNFVNNKSIKGQVTIAIRHEAFIISSIQTADIKATLIAKEFAGRYYRLILRSNNYTFVAEITDIAVDSFTNGDTIYLALCYKHIFVFPVENI